MNCHYLWFFPSLLLSDHSYKKTSIVKDQHVNVWRQGTKIFSKPYLDTCHRDCAVMIFATFICQSLTGYFFSIYEEVWAQCLANLLETRRAGVCSDQLDSDAIVEYVKALVMIAEEELQPINTPRVFSLTKIVEISHYNMGRIRWMLQIKRVMHNSNTRRNLTDSSKGVRNQLLVCVFPRWRYIHSIGYWWHIYVWNLSE